MEGARLDLEQLDGDALQLRLSGSWRIDRPRPSSREAVRELARRAPSRVRFDAPSLVGWDSTLLAFVERVSAACRERAIEVDRGGLPAGVQRLIELAEAVPERREGEAEVAGERMGALERVGAGALAIWERTRAFLGFLGETATALARLATHRATARRSDLLLHLQQCGAGALPIVTLISALIGLIVAFVGAVQLRRFGADLYIADLVSIAIVREMGAMMTGIIMAGRTGAAFAAQLGTMKVTEEIDALSTFGIRPIEFLVLPRVLALSLMMPLLTLYSDLVGILGGAAVGITLLDITPKMYLQQTLDAFTLGDLTLGVVKGFVYGVLVAIAGCLRGLQTGPGASSVGDAATKATVTGIVAIIVADGILAVLSNLLGI
jgi:phospholipid/cholesterol/gamma-HCH transport system permease protein